MVVFSSFRSTKWNPLLILFQILALQLTGILNLWLFLYITSFFTKDLDPTVAVFDDEAINANTTQGWIVLSVHILSSLVNSVLLVLIVERARKCLDFTITFYLFHFITIFIYKREFPLSLLWWITIVVCSIIMTRLGRKLCQNRELLPISLSQHKRVPLISTAEGLNNEIELDELFDELVGGVDGKFEDQDDSMSDIHTKISITSEDSVKDAILSKEPSKSAATIAAPESSSNTEKAALIKKQDTNSNNQAKNTDHNTLLYESHDWDGDSNWDLESNSDSQNQNP